MLGLKDSDIDTVSPSFTKPIATNGIKLADGQLVKSSSSAVFVIAGNQRVLYASSDTFLSYRNSWSGIETYSSTALDQHYPHNLNSVSDILVDKTASKAYLVNANRCFLLDTSSLAAMGKTYTALASAQSYDASIFKKLNLTTCTSPTSFIKQYGQGLVYWLNDGQKHPLYTYSAMLDRNNGISPIVMEASQSFLSGISTGPGYY